LERREEQRRQSVRDGNFFLGWRQFLQDGGGLALDEIQKQFVELMKHPSTAGARSRSELLNAQRLKQDISVAQFLSPSFDLRRAAPSLLAVALQQYQLRCNNDSNALEDMIYLQDGIPAFDASTAQGGILLDEDQVSALWDDMDAIGVAGETSIEVLEHYQRPAGWDVRLRVISGLEGGNRTENDINLLAIRSPWQLELVTGGLLLQGIWVLSVSSPAHARVPLRVTLPIAGVNVLAAAVAEMIVRRRPEINRANLAVLCLPASWLVALAGTRTMRRKTYNPGGTPMYPGMHVLAGNGYLLSSNLVRMSPRGRILLGVGIAGQVAASWFSNRRRSGDGAAFIVESIWSALSLSGIPMLARGIGRMADRVNAEQQAATAAAAAAAYERGWSASFEKVGAANHSARILLNEVMSAAGNPLPLNAGPHLLEQVSPAVVLEKNEYVRAILANALAKRPSIGAARGNESLQLRHVPAPGWPVANRGWR